MDIQKTVDYHSLKGRVIIITGAGQGIGRAYAHHFAAQGAIPVIAEIQADKGAVVAQEINDDGGNALFVETDVGDEGSVNAMAEKVLDGFGRIDGLINNAAMFTNLSHLPFWELPVDEWQRTLQVNVTGPFFCARAVAPAMKDAGWGRIINVSSSTTSIGFENFLHYVTSKSAVIGMTRSLARELGPWNITVNTFWPCLTKTEITKNSPNQERFEKQIEMQCLKRSVELDDLAKVVLFLCSEEAAWVNGHNIAADGGYKFL
ncbi:MAG: glucose 1-dehydrogenase [Rhodospirillales bacterium]|nr:glucose 1-dehydrogenase [Rhodospirillales bacterium]